MKGRSAKRPAGIVSYETQEAAVLAMAGRYGDTPELVVEWGKSGAASSTAAGGTGRGGKRPKWRALRGRIAAGEVSALYAYSLSRLARSTSEMLDLATGCQAAGVPIRLFKEGEIAGDTATGRLYLTVLAAVGAFEAETASERGHERVARFRDEGRHLGEAPTGWKIDADGYLVPADDRSAVYAVLDAFTREGTYRRAAIALNARGVMSPRGRAWNGGTIRTIVTRESGTRVAPARRGSRTHAADPLARLLYCIECGGVLTTAHRTYPSRTGQGMYRGWRCFAAGVATPDHSHPRSITESRIMPAIRAEVDRLRLPMERLVIKQESEQLRGALDARRATIIDMAASGMITADEAKPRLALLTAEYDAMGDAEVDVPSVDWTQPPAILGPILAAIFLRIGVDLSTGAIDATWRIPEWRA